jgi:NAD-dependent SIR2 family protein deacetylase
VQACGGILKSATISFGQALVPEVIERALRVAGQADVLLAVGSSLQVYPVAGAVPAAKSAGAPRRDPQRAGDAVRRHRRRGAAGLDQRNPSPNLR